MRNTFVITYLNVEVLSEDLPELFTHEDAVKECQALGAGWRLPTADEMRFVFTLMSLGVCGNFGELPESKIKTMNSKTLERYEHIWDKEKGRTKSGFLTREPGITNYWYHWIQDTETTLDFVEKVYINNTIRLYSVSEPHLWHMGRQGGYEGGKAQLARVRPFRSL